MHVKMWHALATIRPVIDDEAKARIVKPFLIGDHLCDMDEVAQKRFVGGCGGRHARNFPFRDDQEMDRGLGMNIVESQAEIVFVSDPSRNLAGDDL